MRPLNDNSATPAPPVAAVDAGFKHWNSPIPYLFCGIALMMGLITLALIILACSYRKPPSTSGGGGGGGGDSRHQGHEKTAAKQLEEMQREMEEPKIVVIMAGDNNPTYLAKPVCNSDQQV